MIIYSIDLICVILVLQKSKMAAKQLLQGPGSVAYRIGQGVGGIDADFVSAMPPDYECPICHLAYRDPVQTRDCGHRFCETCIEPILRWDSKILYMIVLLMFFTY